MSRHPLHCARIPPPNPPSLPPPKRLPACWVVYSRASVNFLAAPRAIRHQLPKAVARAPRHRLAAARTTAMIAAAVSVAGHVATPRAVTIPRTTAVTSVARTGKRKTDVMTCARLHVKTAAATPHARKRVRRRARRACPPARRIAVDVAVAKHVPTSRRVLTTPAKAGNHATAMMLPAARRVTILKPGLLKWLRKLHVLTTASRSVHATIRVTALGSTPSIRKLKPSKRNFRLLKPSKRQSHPNNPRLAQPMQSLRRSQPRSKHRRPSALELRLPS